MNIAQLPGLTSSTFFLIFSALSAAVGPESGDATEIGGHLYKKVRYWMESEEKLNEFDPFLRYAENDGKRQQSLLMLRLCDQFWGVLFHHDAAGFFGLFLLDEEWNCSGMFGARRMVTW